MSLVADYGSDSNESDGEANIKIKTERTPSSASSSASEDDEKEEFKVKKEEFQEKDIKPLLRLPTPKFTKTIDSSGSSVFQNRYLEAEHAHEAILQRHVKMVQQDQPVTINGKKICWNHRKGRCRFGHRCKYAHDSDLRKSEQELDEEVQRARASSVICQFDGVSQEKKTNKRPGLTQGLVPGKKVMKMYNLSNKCQM